VPLSGDELPVGDLGPSGAHPAFGISVRPRARGEIFAASIPAPASTASNDPKVAWTLAIYRVTLVIGNLRGNTG
jgi:hypothetical protein